MTLHTLHGCLPASLSRSDRAPGPQPSTYLHVGEGRLEQVEHLAVGQYVAAGHLIIGALARLPLGLLVKDIALADPPHLVAAALGRQHGHGQHLAQVHRAPVGRHLGLPCRRLAAQAEEAEAAGQEARVEVVEHPEPQQEKYGHPQRGQADAHGGHGARDRR
ncbi:mCG147151 [Mus musculus]|uniref:Uncharacterized protein n=1 Tax=Mus musculus TaxID=10090 RepID=Q8C7C0_MOUSE|nr:mCG147151 [Mus musculus]BAC34865.1 unnamed protein product [Mus musculus]